MSHATIPTQQENGLNQAQMAKFEALGDKHLRITIPGEPIPKARARTFMRGQSIAHYDPQDKQKTHITRSLAHATGSDLMRSGFYAPDASYRVDLLFCMPYPHATSQRMANLQLWGIGMRPQKPDIDNLAKFYLDCMNGVIFPDDAQITFMRCEKIYCQSPRTVINIFCMNKPTTDETLQNIACAFSPDEYLTLIKSCRELIETEAARGIDSAENVLKMRTENIAKFCCKNSAIVAKIQKQCKNQNLNFGDENAK
jgi:Holliday junction resolvase RusA-like endonuclease